MFDELAEIRTKLAGKPWMPGVLPEQVSAIEPEPTPAPEETATRRAFPDLEDTVPMLYSDTHQAYTQHYLDDHVNEVKIATKILLDHRLTPDKKIGEQFTSQEINERMLVAAQLLGFIEMLQSRGMEEA